MSFRDWTDTHHLNAEKSIDELLKEWCARNGYTCRKLKSDKNGFERYIAIRSRGAA